MWGDESIHAARPGIRQSVRSRKLAINIFIFNNHDCQAKSFFQRKKELSATRIVRHV